MYEQAKQIGGSAVVISVVVVSLSIVFGIQVEFGMYGPFDPVLESLKIVLFAALAIMGAVSLLIAYDRLTGF